MGQSWIKATWSLRATTLVSLRWLKQPTPPLRTKSLWLLSSHTSSDGTGTHVKAALVLNLVCLNSFLLSVLSWMPSECCCCYGCTEQILSYLNSQWITNVIKLLLKSGGIQSCGHTDSYGFIFPGYFCLHSNTMVQNISLKKIQQHYFQKQYPCYSI